MFENCYYHRDKHGGIQSTQEGLLNLVLMEDFPEVLLELSIEQTGIRQGGKEEQYRAFQTEQVGYIKAGS